MAAPSTTSTRPSKRRRVEEHGATAASSAASDATAVVVIETRRSGLLGAGAYGSVRRGRVHGREVAVKSFLGATAGCWPQSATREVVSLASVAPHPGVMPLHFAYMDARGKPHVVMPLLRTSLSEHVRCTLRGSVPAAQVMSWTAQLLQAVAHVHASGFLHRDVKLENVLLDGAGNAVLADFGMARHRVLGSDLRPLTGNVCSLWTRCPELCVPRTEHLYDDRIDAWSVGCVMLALAAGRYVIRSASAEHSTLPSMFQLLGLPREDWPFLRSVGFSTAAYAPISSERRLANVMAACGDRSDLPRLFYSTALELLSIDSRERATVQAVAARPEWSAMWAADAAGAASAGAGAAAAAGAAAGMAAGGLGAGIANAIRPTTAGLDSTPDAAPPSLAMRRHAAAWAWDVTQALKLHPLTALYGFAAWLRACRRVTVSPGADLVLLAACCSLAAKLNDIAIVLPSAWSKACGPTARVRHIYDAEATVLRVLRANPVAGMDVRRVREGVAALALLAVTEWTLEHALGRAAAGCGDDSAEWRAACDQVPRITAAAAAILGSAPAAPGAAPPAAASAPAAAAAPNAVHRA